MARDTTAWTEAASEGSGTRVLILTRAGTVPPARPRSRFIYGDLVSRQWPCLHQKPKYLLGSSHDSRCGFCPHFSEEKASIGGPGSHNRVRSERRAGAAPASHGHEGGPQRAATLPCPSATALYSLPAPIAILAVTTSSPRAGAGGAIGKASPGRAPGTEVAQSKHRGRDDRSPTRPGASNFSKRGPGARLTKANSPPRQGEQRTDSVRDSAPPNEANVTGGLRDSLELADFGCFWIPRLGRRDGWRLINAPRLAGRWRKAPKPSPPSAFSLLLPLQRCSGSLSPLWDYEFLPGRARAPTAELSPRREPAGPATFAEWKRKAKVGMRLPGEDLQPRLSQQESRFRAQTSPRQSENRLPGKALASYRDFRPRLSACKASPREPRPPARSLRILKEPPGQGHSQSGASESRAPRRIPGKQRPLGKGGAFFAFSLGCQRLGGRNACPGSLKAGSEPVAEFK
ncbi:uncharacterized protein ACOB8E_021614 [Sarcophilus harrisii]